MKKIFAPKPIIITGLIFILMFVLPLIPINCGFLSPVSNALRDFDVYDIVYSRLLEEQTVDTNIVIVNIGDLSRKELSKEIELLNKFQPAVIGIDALFLSPKSVSDDSLLSAALSKCHNLVMVNKLDDFSENTKRFGTVHSSLINFSRYSSGGYANLPNEDEVGFRTIREFRPKEIVNDTLVLSFAAKISDIYRHGALNKLLARDNRNETINFRGNYNRFYFLDTRQFNDPAVDFRFIKDKIILMGYMGPDLQTKTLEDVFFTPLNERYAGKSFPDMYGIVIHANIISMILNGNYINLMPLWISYLLAIIICFLNVKMIMAICAKYKDWFNALTKLFMLIFTVANLFLSLEILHYFNYRINLTLALFAIVLGNSVREFYDSFIHKILHKLLK